VSYITRYIPEEKIISDLFSEKKLRTGTFLLKPYTQVGLNGEPELSFLNSD